MEQRRGRNEVTNAENEKDSTQTQEGQAGEVRTANRR